MSKRNFITKLDSYALTIIALCAVIVSIWQARQQRFHDRISVMPYLDWQMERDDDGFHWLKVKNKGFGPAFIREGRIITTDSSFRDWKAALNYLDSSIVLSRWTSVMGKLTLLPQEEFVFVAAKGGQKDIILTFEIEFKDAYDYKYEDSQKYIGSPFQ